MRGYVMYCITSTVCQAIYFNIQKIWTTPMTTPTPTQKKYIKILSGTEHLQAWPAIRPKLIILKPLECILNGRYDKNHVTLERRFAINFTVGEI